MPKKIILITGATRGLGRAMVEELARLATLFLARPVKEGNRSAPPPFRTAARFQVVDVAVDKEVKIMANQLLDSHAAPEPAS